MGGVLLFVSLNIYILLFSTIMVSVGIFILGGKF